MKVEHLDLGDNAISVYPTGSRVICSPAPTDTDEDFVVLLNQKLEVFEFVELMSDKGYECDGGEVYDILCELEDECGWASFRSEDGKTNYIVTYNEAFYNRFVFATDVAKSMNLLVKEDRKKLFQYILYEAQMDKEF